MTAPQDKGARGRVSWLVSQLSDARADLVIESFAKNARTGTAATLAQIRDDRLAGLDSDRKNPFRFKIVMRAEMGMGRATGTRSPGFISTVLDLISRFYGEVVQQITPWQPSAPKLQPKPEPDAEARQVDPFTWAQLRPDVEKGDDVF